MNFKKAILFVVLSFALLMCKRKDEAVSTDPNAQLVFSSSEIRYDTVFAGLSYPAKSIKVYNRNSEALVIDEVYLAGGVASPYTILVNGQYGPVVTGLELMGGDSMVIYVDLKLVNQSTSTPYIVEDFINFRFNGNQQQIALKAVGNDAILVEPGDLHCAQVWDNQMPIILKGKTVVSAGCTLTVDKGTQVYVMQGSSLDIKGTLFVNGTKLEPAYLGKLVSGKVAGAWLGMQFYEGSSGSVLSWLTLTNAETGISFVSPSATALVDIGLNHAVLLDFTKHALDLSFVSLTASNCLFIASAKNLTAFSQTGDYVFEHCTWAGYSYDYFREGPCIKTSNSDGSLSLKIKHSIVWGDKAEEFDIGPNALVTIDSAVIKTLRVIAGLGQLVNQDPLFSSPVNRNFELAASSPAVNVGLPTLVADDLKGLTRDLLPDMGCYELVP